MKKVRKDNSAPLKMIAFFRLYLHLQLHLQSKKDTSCCWTNQGHIQQCREKKKIMCLTLAQHQVKLSSNCSWTSTNRHFLYANTFCKQTLSPLSQPHTNVTVLTSHKSTLVPSGRRVFKTQECLLRGSSTIN